MEAKTNEKADPSMTALKEAFTPDPISNAKTNGLLIAMIEKSESQEFVIFWLPMACLIQEDGNEGRS